MRSTEPANGAELPVDSRAECPGSLLRRRRKVRRELTEEGLDGELVEAGLLGLDLLGAIARVEVVQVVLRKLGRGSRAVSGRLVRAPRKGSVIVIEFADGMHEYVTTAVKRVLRLAHQDVFYIETVNSRYRLEVRERDSALEDASSG